MNALTKTVKRIAGALTQSNVEALRGHLVSRQNELKSAQRALDEARARRRAAIEADANDAEVDTIEAEIKAAENTLSRANERLQVADERLAHAEQEAKEAADRAARDAHQQHLEKAAPAARQAAHDAAFSALSAIRAIAQLELESKRLASAAQFEQSETAVEAAARLVEGGGREQILESEEVELWTYRNGMALEKQPARILDYGDRLVNDWPKSRQPGDLCTGSGDWIVKRWRFRRERFYPARGESYVEPLAKTLRLPAIIPGFTPIWDKLHYREDPHDLLEEVEKAFRRLTEQMDELAGTKPARGKPQERLVPVVEIPFEIARQKAKKADWVD